MSAFAIAPISKLRAQPCNRVRSSLALILPLFVIATIHIGVALILLPNSAIAQEKLVSSGNASSEAAATLKRFHDHIRGAAQLNFKVSMTVSNSLNGETKRATASFLTRMPNLFRVEVAVKGRKYLVISDGKLITIFRPSNGTYSQQPASTTLLRSMYTVAGLTNISGRMLDFFWVSAATQDVRVFAIPSLQVRGRKCDGIRVVRFEETFDAWFEQQGDPLLCRLQSRRTDGSAMSVNTYNFAWETPTSITAETLTFIPPKDSREVDALELQ